MRMEETAEAVTAQETGRSWRWWREPGRGVVAAVAGLLLLLTLAALFVRLDPERRVLSLQWPHVTSGDEPHYLLMINSILFDRDLNLHEDYARVRAGGLEAGRACAGQGLDHHTYVLNDDGKDFTLCPLLPPAVQLSLDTKVSAVPMVERGSHPVFYPAVLAALVAPFRPRSPADVERLALIVNGVLGWLTLLVTYAVARRGGLSRRPALGVLFLLGTASPWLPYSAMLYSEVLSGLAFAAGLWALLANRPLAAGLAVSAAFAVKPPFVLAGMAWVLAAFWTRRWRMALSLAGVCGVCGLALMAFNYWQTRTVLVSGNGIWIGVKRPMDLLDQLLDRDHGLAPFVPWALLGLWAAMLGVWPLVRRRSLDVVTWTASGLLGCTILLLTYHIQGGYCYGPRYWVPLLPWLAIAATAMVVRAGTAARRNGGRRLLIAAAAVSFSFAVPAALMPARVLSQPPWVALTGLLLKVPLATVADARSLLGEWSGKYVTFEPLVLMAQDPAMFHQVGETVEGGWQARPGIHPGGALLHGPYTRRIPGGPHRAQFRLSADVAGLRDPAAGLAVVEVYDATAGRLLGGRLVRAADLSPASEWTDFDVTFHSRTGAALEFRVWFEGRAPVTVSRVVVE